MSLRFHGSGKRCRQASETSPRQHCLPNRIAIVCRAPFDGHVAGDRTRNACTQWCEHVESACALLAAHTSAMDGMNRHRKGVCIGAMHTSWLGVASTDVIDSRSEDEHEMIKHAGSTSAHRSTECNAIRMKKTWSVTDSSGMSVRIHAPTRFLKSRMAPTNCLTRNLSIAVGPVSSRRITTRSFGEGQWTLHEGADGALFRGQNGQLHSQRQSRHRWWLRESPRRTRQPRPCATGCK